MTPNVPLVVFSDVDDLVMDRRTRSCDRAATALEVLNRRAIPLVLCSGRTRAELEHIHQELGIRHPFICEHGAAVFVPDGYFNIPVDHARAVAGYEVVEFGQPYGHVVEMLHRTAGRLGMEVVGFNDLSVEDVAIDCELPLMEARLAKLRDYSELFTIFDADRRARPRLFKALRAVNLRCRNGDRWDSVGPPVGMDVGVRLLSGLYRRTLGSVATVGFGVTTDHADLLRSVDVPYVVRTDVDSSLPPLSAKVLAAQLVPRAGVPGWSQTICDLVQGAPRPERRFK